MGLSLLVCNRPKQLSTVQTVQCIIHGPSTHICARVWGVSICDNLQKLRLCTVYGWQLDFPNCILMLASLGLTTVFYCILLLALQGKLLTCLPLNPPTGEKGKGETCQIQLRSSAGLETGKAWPCRGEQENVKGAFFGGGWDGRKSKYVWKIVTFFVVGRSSDRVHNIRGLFWDVGPIQSKREHVFGGLLYGGDTLQLGEGKVTQEGRGILNYGKSRNLRKRLNLFLTVISTAS